MNNVYSELDAEKDGLRKLPGAKRRPVRITVLKVMGCDEIYGERPAESLPEYHTDKCIRFREGQTMVVDESGFQPEDFPCQWAWQDLYPIVLTLQLGGNFFWLKDGVQYACCTDGLKPVFFKLERM